jgi:hypothetical protein
MFVIVLNTSNLLQDGQNNKLIYKFPNSVNLKDKYVAIVSISLYYSWFNITATMSNNTFSYSWTGTSGLVTYTILIPDGLYEISDINNLIQWNCINNGTYWTDSTGANFYPVEFIVNQARYAIQINTYLIPILINVDPTWVVPYNFPGWPATSCNSIITIPANFNTIVGYTAGYTTNNNPGNSYSPASTDKYIAKDYYGTLSYISTLAPQVQPNNNVIFSLSGINNPYAQPSSTIYALSPNVEVGSQITLTPPNYAWSKFIDGTYSEIRLTILGSNLQPLQINDPNMTILLAIRDKFESHLGDK